MLDIQSCESRDETAPGTPECGFANLLLSEPVKLAVNKAGYSKPSPIQSEIIPHMLKGRDVLAQSQTGSGKTAAFALPILSQIEIRRGKPQVLVLAPTRELAIQVSESFERYAACLPGFHVAAIYGGQSYEGQFKKLKRGVQVVVGTPGRVIDHIKRGTLDLSELACLVLDEADEMLNMGFLDDVRFVLQEMPVQRQIALFSATLPGPIREIADKYLNDPAKITIRNKTMTAESIRQRALFVSPRDKMDSLKRILEAEESDGVIVFTKTKDSTVSVAEQLNRAGFSAVALNGDMPQRTRERTIERLKAGRLNILVATDVAARGLDVTRISHVFNYDLPHDTQSYIHRIGRTGRAGRKGEAVIFLTGSQRGKLKMIEKVTRQPIEVVQPPSTEVINEMRIKRFGETIADTLANRKDEESLSLFKGLVKQFAEQSGQPLEDVAAALAYIGQQGRPFLMKDLPPRKNRDEHRRERGRSDSRPTKGRGKRRSSGPPASGMIRYRIQVGWRDGVKPGNIVGAVANEAGIEGEYIGPIDINHSFSTIDLPEGMPQDVFHTLQKTWVAGRQLRISLASEKHDEHTEGRPRSKHSAGRPGKGKPSGTRSGNKSRSFKNKKGKKNRKAAGKSRVEAR